MISNFKHTTQLYKHIPASRYIISLTGYTMYLGTSLFFFLLLPFLLIPTLLSLKFKAFIFNNTLRSYLYFLTRFFLPLIRVYKIDEKRGAFCTKRNSPCIYVANHRSFLDGPILLGKLKNTGVIMKATYARLPVFSSLVKHTDFISVDSSSMTLINIALQRSKELIKKGSNLLIFPEGSRSRTSRLLPFKDLAFRLSIETNTPIVPIIIHTDFPLLSKIKKTLIPPFILKLTIKVLAPILPEAKERPADFAERTRRIMVDEIRALDSNTYWESI
jgi:1-acyl-sn-glycerol-3-phosphate acyltransferase